MIDENLQLLGIIFQIVSGILIIFLLGIQSWVLVKLLPEIKSTAKSSKFFTDTMNIKKTVTDYPEELKQLGIMNCKEFHDPKHIHSHECF